MHDGDPSEEEEGTIGLAGRFKERDYDFFRTFSSFNPFFECLAYESPTPHVQLRPGLLELDIQRPESDF